MKAYTDIEQSKKLAEILPIESADMEYLRLKETNATIGSVPFVKDESEVENSAYDAVYERIPCWSLSALLDILPDESDIVKGKLDVVDYKYMCTVCIKEEVITVFDDNLLDACYEMIIKLYKRKLL